MTPKHPWLGLLSSSAGPPGILGTAILALIAAFAIAEGLPNSLNQPLDVNLTFVAIVTMIVGLVAAWKWSASTA